MAEEKRKEPPQIGLISLVLAFVVYTLGFSLLSGHLVTPMEGKGFGFLVILLLYAVFKLALAFGFWVRGRLQKRSP